MFFPPPPPISIVPHTCYPVPANIIRYFTRAQIKDVAKKLNV